MRMPKTPSSGPSRMPIASPTTDSAAKAQTISRMHVNTPPDVCAHLGRLPEGHPDAITRTGQNPNGEPAGKLPKTPFLLLRHRRRVDGNGAFRS
jgi:hypothetical protein